MADHSTGRRRPPGSAAAVSAAEPARLPSPWPARTVRAGRYRLSVRAAEPTSPDAQAAVLVHGLGGSAQNWTDLMALVRDVLDAQAPDLPGFGHSEPPFDGDYSIDGHARAVAALIEAAGRGPVHLAGNSLGGAVVTRLAATRPELVRTLTLVSPALPDLRMRRTSAPTGLMAMPVLGEAVTRVLARQDPAERVRGLLALTYGDPGLVPPERQREAAAEYLRRGSVPYSSQALLRSLRGLMRAYLERGAGSLWQQAAQIRVPTLLVYGGRDKLVDARMADRAAATFPAARLLVLPDSGHVAQMEHPELVASAMRDLVAGAQ